HIIGKGKARDLAPGVDGFGFFSQPQHDGYRNSIGEKECSSSSGQPQRLGPAAGQRSLERKRSEGYSTGNRSRVEGNAHRLKLPVRTRQRLHDGAEAGNQQRFSSAQLGGDDQEERQID